MKEYIILNDQTVEKLPRYSRNILGIEESIPYLQKMLELFETRSEIKITELRLLISQQVSRSYVNKEKAITSILAERYFEQHGNMVRKGPLALFLSNKQFFYRNDFLWYGYYRQYALAQAICRFIWEALLRHDSSITVKSIKTQFLRSADYPKYPAKMESNIGFILNDMAYCGLIRKTTPHEFEISYNQKGSFEMFLYGLFDQFGKNRVVKIYTHQNIRDVFFVHHSIIDRYMDQAKQRGFIHYELFGGLDQYVLDFDSFDTLYRNLILQQKA
jgi:hypothetical protein